MTRAILTAAALCLCAGAAQAAPRSCAPCGPTQCAYSAQETNAARDVLKKRMMRIGQPARLVSPIVDKLATCAYCLAPEETPGLMIMEVKDAKRMRSYPWTPRDEWLCRNDLRSGKIKAFYVMMWAEACECCSPGRTASAPWVRDTPARKRRDWDARFEYNKDLVIPFESAQAAGPMPADLQGIR